MHTREIIENYELLRFNNALLLYPNHILLLSSTTIFFIYLTIPMVYFRFLVLRFTTIIRFLVLRE